MIGRLQVNGVEIELTEGVPFPLNFSIADIKEPNKRKRNYSKSLAISGTKKNLDFFSSTYLLSLSTVNGTTNIGFDFDPTLRVPAKYWSDNGELLFNGLFQLEQVMISGGNYVFQCKLFSNFIDLFMKLGDLKVSELGWSEYNHALTRSNVFKSWATSVKLNGSDTSNFSGGLPLGFGYHYGMVDYGYSSTNTMKINDLAPLIYKREVFEKCLEVSGLTWDSAFLDSSFYKKHLLGFGGGDKIGYPTNEINNRQCNFTETYFNEKTISFVSNSGNVLRYYFNKYVDLLASWDGATSTIITDGFNQNKNFVIKIQKQGTYSLTYTLPIASSFTYIGNDVGGLAHYNLDVTKNGAVIKNYTDNMSSLASLYLNITDTLNLFLDSGDEIGFRFNIFFDYKIERTAFTLNSAPLNVQIENDTTPFSFNLQCIQASLITGDTVELSRFIPELKASQFLEAELLMYNLYLSDADINGVVKIEPLNDYYQDTTEFIDITDIVDFSKDIIIKPASTIEGKRYKFLWAEDKDFDNEAYRSTFNYGYGDHIYTVPSTFQTGDRVYQLPYAQTVVRDNIPPFVRPRIVKLNANVIQPFKGKPRNYIYNGLKSGAWRLTDTDGVIYTDYSTYPCVHHFDNYQNPTFDLNWGLPIQLAYQNNVVTTDNLYRRYHERFIKEITGKDSKLVELYVKFNSNDIANLDFSKSIMWNGVLFRLNEVRDFDNNLTTSTQIEIVRIIEANNIEGEISYHNDVDGWVTNGDDGILSPDGIGQDSGVIWGGIDEILTNNELIHG
jgi:hypothetical protein